MLTRLLQEQFDFHYRNDTNIDELRQQERRQWVLDRGGQGRAGLGRAILRKVLFFFLSAGKQRQVRGSGGGRAGRGAELSCRAHT